jgi:ABC-type hemin transport system ATPase subunit
MSATDDSLYEIMVKVENKDIFVDVKKNKGGTYMKISERNGAGRNTVLIPISGLARLREVFDEVSKITGGSGKKGKASK